MYIVLSFSPLVRAISLPSIRKTRNNGNVTFFSDTNHIPRNRELIKINNSVKYLSRLEENASIMRTKRMNLGFHRWMDASVSMQSRFKVLGSIIR